MHYLAQSGNSEVADSHHSWPLSLRCHFLTAHVRSRYFPSASLALNYYEIVGAVQFHFFPCINVISHGGDRRLMASVAGPPPGIDLAADQGRRVVSSGIALLVLSTSFVILRFASRSIANAGYWWDDFLVVVSLFLSYGPNIAMMICKSFQVSLPQRVSSLDL